MDFLGCFPGRLNRRFWGCNIKCPPEGDRETESTASSILMVARFGQYSNAVLLDSFHHLLPGKLVENVVRVLA